ncbi:MAG: PCYCGC motif-containing (lipo)protein [Acidobacteriota bacterium]
MKKRRSLSNKYRREEKLALVAAGVVVLAFMYWASRSTQPSRQTEAPGSMKSDSGRATRVPPFHSSPEAAGTLPRTLPAGFRDPNSAHAYRIAGQIPSILAQQPCYCWCDQYGHRSLLDCFVSDHAAG